MKKNVMIDLETLGTRPGCVVLEMAAVAFDEGDAPEAWATWESGLIDLESSMAAGMHLDADTVKWWAGKPGFLGMLQGDVNCHAAPAALWRFLREHWDADKGVVWCWGASFDFPIVKDAIGRALMVPPWNHWRERDARTLCQVAGVLRTGVTEHRALADALCQVEAVQEALGKLSTIPTT